MRWFHTFSIAHDVVEACILKYTELLPGIRFKSSSITIDLFFKSDIWDIKDNAFEIIVE